MLLRILFSLFSIPLIIFVSASAGGPRELLSQILLLVYTTGIMLGSYFLHKRRSNRRTDSSKKTLEQVEQKLAHWQEAYNSEVEGHKQDKKQLQEEMALLRRRLTESCQSQHQLALILPVLVEQVKAVIQYTDSSVSDLISAFLAISSRAKSHTNEIKELFSDIHQSGRSDSRLLEENKTIFSRVLAHSSNSIDLTYSILDSIKSIIDESRSIQSVLGGIQDITEQTKVLSLNAVIEASRAQAKGGGFSVVAKEMKRLSEKSSTITTKIENQVNVLIDNCQNTFAGTKVEIGNIIKLSESSEQSAQNSIHKIDTYLENLEAKLNTISEYTDSLAGDIGKIVMSIQFQDITRQRLEHVITPLQELTEKYLSLCDTGEDFSSAETGDRDEEIRNWLEKFYTMQDEKTILDKFL